MVIRSEQMDVHRGYMLDKFVARAGADLRRKYPKAPPSRSEGDMDNFVRAGVKESHAFDIYREANVVAYLDCAVVYGLGFAANPHYSWARTILKDATANETEKMNQINEHRIFTEDLGGKVE